eukprot:scaffold211660_cov24-Tisochrysis_lutea.AAC.1
MQGTGSAGFSTNPRLVACFKAWTGKGRKGSYLVCVRLCSHSIYIGQTIPPTHTHTEGKTALLLQAAEPNCKSPGKRTLTPESWGCNRPCFAPAKPEGEERLLWYWRGCYQRPGGESSSAVDVQAELSAPAGQAQKYM